MSGLVGNSRRRFVMSWLTSFGLARFDLFLSFGDFCSYILFRTCINENCYIFRTPVGYIFLRTCINVNCYIFKTPVVTFCLGLA